MKNKKMIFICIAIILLIIVGVCIKNRENKNATLNGGKGSRSNPYSVGDTIKIKDMHSTWGIDKNISFDLVFTVTKSYSVNEGLAAAKKMYSSFSAVPAAKVVFKLNGNYDDSIGIGKSLFSFGVVTENMQEKNYFLEREEDFSSLTSFFTGTEYNAIIPTEYNKAKEEVEKAKYVIFTYYDKNEKEHKIYVEL